MYRIANREYLLRVLSIVPPRKWPKHGPLSLSFFRIWDWVIGCGIIDKTLMDWAAGQSRWPGSYIWGLYLEAMVEDKGRFAPLSVTRKTSFGFFHCLNSFFRKNLISAVATRHQFNNCERTCPVSFNWAKRRTSPSKYQRPNSKIAIRPFFANWEAE